VVALLLPLNEAAVLRTYVVALGACGLWWLVGLVRKAHPPLRPPAIHWRRPDREEGPAQLRQLESAVLFSRTTAFDFYHGLRPLLRAIAEDRLAGHHAIDLEQSPEAARRLLGEEAFAALVTEPEPERRVRGLSLERQRRVVEALERL
jgi:hypothetical protein